MKSLLIAAIAALFTFAAPTVDAGQCKHSGPITQSPSYWKWDGSSTVNKFFIDHSGNLLASTSVNGYATNYIYNPVGQNSWRDHKGSTYSLVNNGLLIWTNTAGKTVLLRPLT